MLFILCVPFLFPAHCKQLLCAHLYPTPKTVAIATRAPATTGQILLHPPALAVVPAAAASVEFTDACIQYAAPSARLLFQQQRASTDPYQYRAHCPCFGGVHLPSCSGTTTLNPNPACSSGSTALGHKASLMHGVLDTRFHLLILSNASQQHLARGAPA